MGPLISWISRLVKYYNLARMMVYKMGLNSNDCVPWISFVFLLGEGLGAYIILQLQSMK